MSEAITLTLREQTRLEAMSLMDRGKLRVSEAATLLGMSERQVWRLRAAYREEGATGLIHGNRGRTSDRRVESEERRRIVELAEGNTYKGCNQLHFTQLLAEREGIRLGRSTVRRILTEAGIESPKKRRPARHRRRRVRSAERGMLLQIDGSPHDWLEERGPRLCLRAGIDDATGEIHGATFRDQEDAAGYLEGTCGQVARYHGIPMGVYHDRHTIFGSKKAVSIEAQLAGRRREPSHVERAMQDLGIRSIAARSPQAKGRIERLLETLQDRLVVGLRFSGSGHNGQGK